MGSQQSKKVLIKDKYSKDIEQLYKMYDCSIQISRKSIISSFTQNNQIQNNQSYVSISKQSRIMNLESVLDQLLQQFAIINKYAWGTDICQMFKLHFSQYFEQIWSINKQQFYQIILSSCQFQTIDFKQQLSSFSKNFKDNKAYQSFFYKVGAQRLSKKLPQSFLGQVQLESIVRQVGQININTLNHTIIANQHNPDQYLNSCIQLKKQEDDFLPLFINPNSGNNIKSKKQQIMQARIQNSSLVMPQTIFMNRMSMQSKNQIQDLVRFYKAFGNALQRFFFSASLISIPFKHFICSFTQKLKKKNILKPSSVQDKSNNKHQYKKSLLYQDTAQGKQFRKVRQNNNILLFDQIKDFCNAYTDFIWKYLELYNMVDMKLGKLMNIDTLYGIILKAVWNYAQVLILRGYEYQDYLLQKYYKENGYKITKIQQSKKTFLKRILKKLKNQKNPQKYLKTIVIFYRQASMLGNCADDLLNVYEQLIGSFISDEQIKSLNLFRMKRVIQRLLKIDDSYNGGGQISYAWTTWCIVLQLLYANIKQKINNSQNKSPKKLQRLISEQQQLQYL